jgi:hypothetical protein
MALHDVAARLVESFGQHDPERTKAIQEMVMAEAGRFDDAKIQMFVPILVERAVRNRLRPRSP